MDRTRINMTAKKKDTEGKQLVKKKVNKKIGKNFKVIKYLKPP